MIGNLDPDRAFARHPLDQNRFGCHRETKIISEAGDAGDFDSCLRLELKRCDNRPRIDLRYLSIYAKLSGFLTQDSCLFPKRLFANDGVLFIAIEQRGGGQFVAAYALGHDHHGFDVRVGALPKRDAVRQCRRGSRWMLSTLPAWSWASARVRRPSAARPLRGDPR